MSNGVQRRQLLLATGALACGKATSAEATSTIADTSYADPEAAEAWMETWMKSRLPVGTLHMSRFKDRTYFLLKQIGWQPNPGDKKLPIVKVPKGFVTDFASIPRVFWSALPPDGDYTYPAIIHDYLYWTQTTSRKTADDILDSAMSDFKINSTQAALIYGGVRAGGQSAWDGNAKLKSAGEKRILKVYPEDPTITWEIWKSDKRHF